MAGALAADARAEELGVCGVAAFTEKAIAAMSGNAKTYTWARDIDMRQSLSKYFIRGVTQNHDVRALRDTEPSPSLRAPSPNGRG